MARACGRAGTPWFLLLRPENDPPKREGMQLILHPLD